ncbi:hypothetical protein [Bacillus mesophilum]|uniref:Uncharacterized protein n=1 Tax=Bacillus mesophilum TaxID=1071718 RepID=A0A7V7RI11_9BACI|nr:hypothetical protein [Bacillus mesophilum]KAB2329430.1 hypothetical protein F7732_21125 [Bacillus mesophilum]
MEENNFKDCIMAFEKEQSLPLIIRKPIYLDRAEWIYPISSVSHLRNNCSYQINAKTEKTKLLKILVDLFTNQSIGTSTVHIGFVLIFGSASAYSSDYYFADEVTEKNIGRKRIEVLSEIPEMRIVNNDEFLGLQHSQMVHENVESKQIEKIRLMYDSKLYQKLFGGKYKNNEIAWIEPTCTDDSLKVRLWDKNNHELKVY